MSLFRAALTDALDKTGMTAIALASKAEVNRSRLSEFLRDKDPTLPKDENLVAICKALPADHAARVAQAWVRERLGSTLSDAILSIGPSGGSGIDQLFSSLPTDAANAFRLLMEISREDPDLRQSVVSLAAFAKPDDSSFQITHIIGPDTPNPQSSLSQEISDTPTAPAVDSPSTTNDNPPAVKSAKLVKLRTHITPESEKKVAEAPSPYKTRKKNGTED